MRPTYLRHVRQGRGLTLKEVAKAAGIHEAYLSLIERGRRRCSVPLLVALLRALGEAREADALAAWFEPCEVDGA